MTKKVIFLFQEDIAQHIDLTINYSPHTLHTKDEEMSENPSNTGAMSLEIPFCIDSKF